MIKDFQAIWVAKAYIIREDVRKEINTVHNVDLGRYRGEMTRISKKLEWNESGFNIFDEDANARDESLEVLQSHLNERFISTTSLPIKVVISCLQQTLDNAISEYQNHLVNENENAIERDGLDEEVTYTPQPSQYDALFKAWTLLAEDEFEKTHNRAPTGTEVSMFSFDTSYSFKPSLMGDISSLKKLLNDAATSGEFSQGASGDLAQSYIKTMPNIG